jgi:formylglycine-generating enzyme required for sulfatase activity
MTLLRGASWNNDNPQNARAAYRNHNNNPRNRNDNNGARLARGPIRPLECVSLC